MYKLRGELVNMRNIVDDTLYGCKQMAEVEKRKFIEGILNLEIKFSVDSSSNKSKKLALW